MNKTLLLIGGVVNLVFGVFHLLLGRALNWSETLSCLTPDNRATIYTASGSPGAQCFIKRF